MGHPDEVIAYLAAGNQRYATGLAEPRDYAVERERTHDLQEPFAAVLTCADSRVPVERLFDCGLGELIVARTAGHVLDDAVTRTLGFAVEDLGVGAIVVLGHTNCAAVYTATHEVRSGSAAEWIGSQVRMSLWGETVEGPSGAERAHARATARAVAGLPSIREAVDRGDLVVRPALYDLRSGRVSWLEA